MTMHYDSLVNRVWFVWAKLSLLKSSMKLSLWQENGTKKRFVQIESKFGNPRSSLRRPFHNFPRGKQCFASSYSAHSTLSENSSRKSEFRSPICISYYSHKARSHQITDNNVGLERPSSRSKGCQYLLSSHIPRSPPSQVSQVLRSLWDPRKIPWDWDARLGTYPRHFPPRRVWNFPPIFRVGPHLLLRRFRCHPERTAICRIFSSQRSPRRKVCKWWERLAGFECIEEEESINSRFRTFGVIIDHVFADGNALMFVLWLKCWAKWLLS